jgi:hypothetical protein
MHEKPGPERARAIFRASKRSEGDRGHALSGLALERAHAPEQLITVDLGHADVAHQHVRLVLPDEQQGLVGATGGDNVGFAIQEHPPDQLTRVGFVIDHQHAHARQVDGPEGGRH